MKLKNWKKISENKWQKNKVTIGVIYSDFAMGKNKYVLVERDRDGIERIRRQPTSKSKALTFAKAYMKTH